MTLNPLSLMSDDHLGLVNPLAQDQATLAQRRADAPMLARKPQSACDLGLFSDDARQADLLDMDGVRK
jgi:hypothetical protein